MIVNIFSMIVIVCVAYMYHIFRTTFSFYIGSLELKWSLVRYFFRREEKFWCAAGTFKYINNICLDIEKVRNSHKCAIFFPFFSLTPCENEKYESDRMCRFRFFLYSVRGQKVY